MIRIASTALLLVLVLTGCVPSPTPDPTAAPTPNPTEAPEATPTPTSGDDPAAWTPAGTPVDAAAYAHPDGGVVFSSPSGNIQCGYSHYSEPGWWWCLLIEQTVELPAASEEACEGLTPNGLGVKGADPNATPESFCAGAVESLALPYGSSITYREMACDSTEDGMTCRSLESGHGFRLSRSDYELF